MSDRRKLWLGIGAVAGLCVCAAAAMLLLVQQAAVRIKDSVKTNPTDIAAVGDRIAEYDVPAGFRESGAFSLFMYDAVYITPESGGAADTMIMLMQFTQGANTDPAEMQRAIEQQTGRPTASLRVIENRAETIRGEEVTITISESTTEGYRLVQWMTVFPGNHGPTMLMIQGAAAGWDEDLATKFIHSIR